MAEPSRANDARPQPTPPPVSEPVDAGHVPITEEFDRAKWTLPPLGVVGIALAVIAIVVGLFAWRLQPKPAAAGSIDDVFAVATPDGKTMATVKVTYRNAGEGKSLYIRNLKAKVTTAQGEFEDEAASATDFDRYFEAFPALREHTAEPLRVETRVPAGLQTQGSIIVAFPVSIDDFNNRKSLSVIIEPYDQKSLTITR